jgi:alpha-ribazole phosphatase
MKEELNVLVLLARHGETLWNEMKRIQGRTDVSLSGVGREQAKALSSALASIRLSSIYCSPLLRAKETAEILAEPHKFEPKIDEGLIEINFGEWEGQTHSALRERFPEQYERWLIDPSQVDVPKSERLTDVQARVMRSFQRITEENNGKAVAVVGHGGVNRALLLSLLQARSEAFWRLRQDVACLNVIEVSRGIPRISLLNSTAHLKTDYSQLIWEAATRCGISP